MVASKTLDFKNEHFKTFLQLCYEKRLLEFMGMHALTEHYDFFQEMQEEMKKVNNKHRNLMQNKILQY